jgi:polyadenylate-binding protein
MFRIDDSVPCVSNGYGFVCFENEEDAKKLIGLGTFEAVQAIQYQLKDPKSIKKQYNNIYVKNFDPSWDEAKLREVFGKFGNIHSVMMKNDINNAERKFAFICFHDPENKDHGFQAADRAVQELNDPNPNGLYVQPALTSIERQGVIRREQQRFKNSKKKCNLFVKNFPPEFTDENLRQLFGDHGEIESVKILPTHEGQPSCRAFVCFKQPDSAALARSKLHQQIFQGKQLYVTNYELPEIRKKQQAEAKDKADFYNQRKQFATNTIDASLLQKPDTI